MSSTRPCVRRSRLLILLLVAGWTLSGCTTWVQARAPRPPVPPNPATGGEPVAVDGTIEGLPEKLGFNTFTLFAIPIGRIRLDPKLATPLIIEGLEAALEGAGRSPVSAADHPDAPRLVTRIRKMRFHSYRWPVVIVAWGRLELSIALVDAGGIECWQRTYEVRDHQASFGRVIENMVNGALHEAVSRAARDFASPEFGAACQDARSASRSRGRADEHASWRSP